MTTESVQRVELEGWNYVLKYQERLHFICLNVQNRKEITDEDYSLLRTVFKIAYDGEYPLYENRLDLPLTNAEQVGLFADKSAVSTTAENSEVAEVTEKEANINDGTCFDNTYSEPIDDNNE